MITDNINYEKIDLYHYTSLEALKSIISNKTLRLTNFKDLNDKTEILYAIKQIKETIIKTKIDSDADLFNLVTQLENEESTILTRINPNENNLIFEKNKNTGIYLLSMTNSCDDSYMWNNYGSGCCIKFDSNNLFKFIYQIRDKLSYKHFFNPIRGKVMYGSAVELAYEMLKYLKELEGTSFYLNEYYNALQLTSLFKSDFYKNEIEYRIGFYFPNSWFVDNFILDENNNKIVKHIEGDKNQIELLNFPFKEIITEIIISPKKSENDLLEIKNFVKQQFGFEIPIRHSSISNI